MFQVECIDTVHHNDHFISNSLCIPNFSTRLRSVARVIPSILAAVSYTHLFGVKVRHLGRDGRISAHRITEGVRVDGRGGLVYDAGHPRLDSDRPAGLADRPLST